jgi:hypothetical protein
VTGSLRNVHVRRNGATVDQGADVSAQTLILVLEALSSTRTNVDDIKWFVAGNVRHVPELAVDSLEILTTA